MKRCEILQRLASIACVSETKMKFKLKKNPLDLIWLLLYRGKSVTAFCSYFPSFAGLWFPTTVQWR